MVGICGVLGDGTLPEEMAAWTEWRDDEARFEYRDERVELALSSHSMLADEQPVAIDDGDVLLWVWGDVYGHGSGDAYTPRRGPPDGSARYCARLYRDHGPSFVADLNGDFAIVLYDRSNARLSFVTDRLATRPFYYATPGDDAFVFASALQALPHYPGVSTRFDREYLQEYLSLRRVFGVETPLVGVRELPPASVVDVDLHDLSAEVTTYWRPSYDPVDRPASYFADRLADTMQTLFSEWTSDDLDYGVLLSGGSDSRLVQACIDQPVVSFHNADWMSREAKVARRVAETSGDEFHLLERYDDHEARSLETTPALADFSGWFDQAYFTEFADEITDSVDVLVSGLFADVLFRGGPLRTRSLSLSPVGTLSLPMRRPVTDVSDYVDLKTRESQPLPFFESARPTRTVVADNVSRTDAGLVSHGVQYDSLTDLVMYGDFYPLSADTESIFPRSLMQLCPYRTPFFDNRIVDLHSKIPMRYFLRRNVVDDAVQRVSPDLADIPHARTGVPLRHSFSAKYLGTNLNGFYRKHVRDDPVPEPHFTHDPWPNREELLRTHSFARDCVEANEDLIRDLPFFDYDAVQRTLDAHLDGADNTVPLYSLLTFLEMPLLDDRGKTPTVRGRETAPSDVSTRREAPAAGRRVESTDVTGANRSAIDDGGTGLTPAAVDESSAATSGGADAPGGAASDDAGPVSPVVEAGSRLGSDPDAGGVADRLSANGSAMRTELFGVFGDAEDFSAVRSRDTFDTVVEGVRATVGVRAPDLGVPGRSATYAGAAGVCVLFGEVVPPAGPETDPARWLCERYAEEGPDALDALNGSYLAFVEADGRPLVATDPVRSWECYYTDVDGVRVFGTDVTALTRLRSPLDPVRRSVLEFLHLGTVLGERTLFDSIQRVPFDGYLTPSSVETLSRFRYDPRDFDHVGELAARLERAIRRRGRYPGRKGVLLSGGSDSRVFLSQFDDVDATYTIGSQGSREVRVAKRVAEQYGVSHTTLEPGAQYLYPFDEKLLYGHGIKETLHIHHAGYTDAMDADVMYHGLLFDTLFKGYFLERDGTTLFGSELPSTALASDPDPVDSLLDTLGYLPSASRRLAGAVDGAFDALDVDLHLDSPRDFLRRSLESELASCWERTESPHTATELLVIKNQPVLPFRTHLADNFLESFVALDADLLSWHLQTPPGHRNGDTFAAALSRVDDDLLRHPPQSQPHDSTYLNLFEHVVRRGLPFVEPFEPPWPDRQTVYRRHHLDERLFPDVTSVRDLPVRQQLRVNDVRWWLSPEPGGR